MMHTYPKTIHCLFEIKLGVLCFYLLLQPQSKVKPLYYMLIPQYCLHSKSTPGCQKKKVEGIIPVNQ